MTDKQKSSAGSSKFADDSIEFWKTSDINGEPSCGRWVTPMITGSEAADLASSKSLWNRIQRHVASLLPSAAYLRPTSLKKLMFVTTLALGLTGCTFTAADKVAPGQFMITSHGSIFNSREGLLENINQKAAKVCEGKPYHLEGDAGANMVLSTPTQIGPTPTTVLGLKAICEDL